MAENTTDLERIVIFRTSEWERSYIHKELRDGRLRQGWGGPNMDLRDISKEQWEENYKHSWGERPSPRRYSALIPLLQIKKEDVVVIPKMPEWNQFSIARVRNDYGFNPDLEKKDFGHIIPVNPGSIRTFSYRASDDSYMVAGIFSRANHRYPVTFAYNKIHIDAVLRLLSESQDCLEEKEKSELTQAALDDALKKAAESMQEEVKSWNGHLFEEAVKKVFENQGYEILNGQYSRYNRKGGDVDIIVRPPSNIYGIFMPQEIAVQVKWKQGVDQEDVHAVRQLVDWNESDTVEKFVISSADDFTNECKKKAEDNGIMLISGLNTMYFLMGLSNPIRE